MIALTISLTVTVVVLMAFFGGGLMFSRSASYGVATVLAGCALLSLIAAIFWIGIVIGVVALLVAAVGVAAGEN